jgi:hypothetical protein
MLKITGGSDFIHRPVFYKLENTTFRKLDLFPSSDEEETPILLGPLETASLDLLFLTDSIEKISPPQRRTGNRSSF